MRSLVCKGLLSNEEFSFKGLLSNEEFSFKGLLSSEEFNTIYLSGIYLVWRNITDNSNKRNP